MINTKLFTIRLNKILDFYNLSASAFAEKMGIGRSSISHIISGRNKPSLEFVLHILDAFEEVSFDWLLYGKGNFPKIENTPSTLLNQAHQKSITEVNAKTSKNTLNDTSPDLFSNTPANPIIENTVIPPLSINSDIERVIIFYKNGNFKEYKN